MKKLWYPLTLVTLFLLVVGCTSVATQRTPPRPVLKAAPGNAYNLTLAWSAVTDTNTPVAGYRLYSGTTSGVYTTVNTVLGSASTQCIVSNLLVGVTNYFAATAFDTNNLESAYSGEINYVLFLPPPPGSNVLMTLTTYWAPTPTGPWQVFTGAPAVAITNPPPPSGFFRLSITSTNF